MGGVFSSSEIARQEAKIRLFVENFGTIDKEKTFAFRLVEGMVRGVVVRGGRNKGKKKKREGIAH